MLNPPSARSIRFLARIRYLAVGIASLSSRALAAQLYALGGDKGYMSLWPRISVAVAIAAVAGFLAFMTIFVVVGRYASCPPDVQTCDLPMMAGFSLGVIAGPLVAIGAGVWSFRRLGRTRPSLR